MISDMGTQRWDDKYRRESFSAAKKKKLSWKELNFLAKFMRQLFKLISDVWKQNGST